MQAVSGRTRESGKRPRLTSGLQGERCWGRTISIDSEVRTLDHLNDLRHAHPSAIPVLPSFPSCRHSRPAVIPTPPPFLRPLRHSCGGRNPCDRPTVRRASIRPTAHQSPQRAAGDRAPSSIGSALDPTDRLDSCLRRNDGGGLRNLAGPPSAAPQHLPPRCGGRVVQTLLSPQSPQAAEALRCDVSRGRFADNDIMAARLRRHRPGLGRPESTSATRSRTLARNSSSCSSRSHSSAVGGGGAGPTTSRA